MKKFTNQVNEGKMFIPDPSILKKYAAFIIPLYITGKVKCDEVLLDEYLELYKKGVKVKNANVVSDLEIAAVKLVQSPRP